MIKIGKTSLPEEINKLGSLDRPGTPKLDGAPSDYIIVNDPNILNAAKENTCVILFDWDTFISNVIGTGVLTQTKIDFISAINEILNRLKETKDINYQANLEETLNKEINKALLEFRTTVDMNLGSSSCNFTLENLEDKWIVKNKNNIFYGQSIIQEGIKFIIDVKGRFNTDYFYRIWTGYVTAVTESTTPTDRKLSFTSMDISRAFVYTRWNVHPAIYETDLVADQANPTIFSSNLQAKNGARIVSDLTTFSKQKAKYELAVQEEWHDISNILGSKKRTSEIDFGLDSNKDGIVDEDHNFNYHFGYKSSTLTSYQFKANPAAYRLIWGHTGAPYTQLFGNLSLYFSEFRTRKDILTDIANITYYKIYIDPAGNLHYHPPRFEEEHYLVVKDSVVGSTENPLIHCIFDDEVIAQSYTQTESEVCTVARGMQEGGFGIFQAIEKNVMPNTYQSTIIWEDGINRFGFRERKITTGAIKSSAEHIDVFTAAFLLRANQERFQMSATMPMRPEIQVDRPVYDYNKDKVYYIRNVTHNFSAGSANSGGTYTTTIVCNAGRKTSEKISSNVMSTAGQYDTVTKMKAGTQPFTTMNILDLRHLTKSEIAARQRDKDASIKKQKEADALTAKSRTGK